MINGSSQKYGKEFLLSLFLFLFCGLDFWEKESE